MPIRHPLSPIYMSSDRGIHRRMLLLLCCCCAWRKDSVVPPSSIDRSSLFVQRTYVHRYEYSFYKRRSLHTYMTERNEGGRGRRTVKPRAAVHSSYIQVSPPIVVDRVCVVDLRFVLYPHRKKSQSQDRSSKASVLSYRLTVNGDDFLLACFVLSGVDFLAFFLRSLNT